MRNLATAALTLVVVLSLIASACGATPKPLFGQPQYSAKIDVGGYNLAIQCWGKGSVTVILDANLGQGIASWQWGVPDVAARTRVCAYNRAGVPTSDNAPTKPRTSQQMADDLYRLLSNAKIKPPPTCLCRMGRLRSPPACSTGITHKTARGLCSWSRACPQTDRICYRSFPQNLPTTARP